LLSRQEIPMDGDELGRTIRLIGIAAATAVVVAAAVIAIGRLLL